MDFIYSIISQGLSFIIPMIILLGVLIFIHELGHFLVAKHFNVKVEVFSLGFGPKIWKMTRGETTYCLSAIPFGGYVKMFGDELGGNVDPAMRDRSFLHKPIYQRISIALAGPIMNLILAYFLFLALGLLGEQVIAAKLGDIDETSVASQAGFKSGDRILNVSGHNTNRWEDVEHLIAEGLGTELVFKVQRETSEEPVTLKATPTEGTSKNIFESGRRVGQIEGLDFLSNASLIAVSDPKSIFGQLGFKTGDQILAINDTQVKTFRNLHEALLSEATGDKMIVSIERYGTSPDAKPEKMKIEWDLKQIPFPDKPEKLGIEKPETFVGEVQKDSPAANAGIQANDQIAMINGKQIRNFGDIVAVISSYKEDQKELTVDVLRGGEMKSIKITPKMTEIKSEIGLNDKRFAIGIKPLKSTYVHYAHWRAASLGAAIVWAGRKTWQWTHATVMSFVLLAQNKVSPKNLGGFISIGQMAQKSWEVGADAFLRIMAIVSLNLFILNLLPIPVLDGGHILLFSIEAVKGAPISLRKLEIAQQIGVFVLLFLLAFSLFNDFSRLFGAS